MPKRTRQAVNQSGITFHKDGVPASCRVTLEMGTRAQRDRTTEDVESTSVERCAVTLKETILEQAVATADSDGTTVTDSRVPQERGVARLKNPTRLQQCTPI